MIEKFCRKGHLECEPLTVDNNFKIALRGDGGEGCQIILTDSQDEDSVPSEVPPNSFFLIPDYFANFQIFPDVNYVCKVFQYVTILQPSLQKKKYNFTVQYSKKWSLMTVSWLESLYTCRSSYLCQICFLFSIT